MTTIKGIEYIWRVKNYMQRIFLFILLFICNCKVFPQRNISVGINTGFAPVSLEPSDSENNYYSGDAFQSIQLNWIIILEYFPLEPD